MVRLYTGKKVACILFLPPLSHCQWTNIRMGWKFYFSFTLKYTPNLYWKLKTRQNRLQVLKGRKDFLYTVIPSPTHLFHILSVRFLVTQLGLEGTDGFPALLDLLKVGLCVQPRLYSCLHVGELAHKLPTVVKHSNFSMQFFQNGGQYCCYQASILGMLLNWQFNIIYQNSRSRHL